MLTYAAGPPHGKHIPDLEFRNANSEALQYHSELSEIDRIDMPWREI